MPKVSGQESVTGRIQKVASAPYAAYATLLSALAYRVCIAFMMCKRRTPPALLSVTARVS